MANDAHEEFWGCTLTKDKKQFMWDPTTESEDDIEHKLQVTSACLGPKAKDGERNLVELTTEDDDGKKITCSMVSLRAGGKECLHLELGFNNPTKFVLKEGSGPISLCGVHLQAIPLDFDEGDSDESDEDIPNLVEENSKKKVSQKESAEVKNTLKRPLEEENKISKDKQLAKKKKSDPIQQKSKGETSNKKGGNKEDEKDEDEDEEDSEDEGGEDSEDEDEEDSENEEMPSLLDGEADEADDDESEDEDEPEEGDDVDSDEDNEEDDSDEEESEEEEKPKKKLKLTNGHTPAKGGKKEDKAPQKTPVKKEPVTSKSPGPKKTPAEIKAMLLKSPNLPKKFDKFANFMKNNMKVIDEKSQKEFWDYVQKNKK